LKLLLQVAYTDLFYQLDVKVIQAKTLYELQAWETLDNLILSFKKLVMSKRKLSKHYQISYKKFFSYLQKLLHCQEKNEVKIILQQLSNDAEVPDKSWLMEKLEMKKAL
jgi:hypothetical protein